MIREEDNDPTPVIGSDSSSPEGSSSAQMSVSNMVASSEVENADTKIAKQKGQLGGETLQDQPEAHLGQ